MESLIDKNQNDNYPCEQISPMFKLLSPEELQIVEENKINIHFKAGEIIQKQGTFMSHIIFIVSGMAKVYFEREDQNNTILRIVKPMSFVGGPGIYSDHFYHFTIAALKDTSVCYIDFAVFKNILNQNIAFASEFLKDFSISILSVYNRLMALANKNIAGKMAYSLLYLLEEVHENKEQSISISKHDLADLSAVSRDSSVKILRDFQKEGIIRMTDHVIEIIKPEKLRLIESVG
jgi:CRP-like cAMP-binding protein